MTIRETVVAYEVVVTAPFEETVERCRTELAAEGFGVLCEIDLQAKLLEKLGARIPPNLILGACHPPSAHRALEASPEVTVLLPCNVAIAVEERGTVVRAMNPEAAMPLLGGEEMAAVAREVGAALRRVLERVDT